MTPERWRQIKELLEAAWERDAAERGRFLDQVCANDAELRSHVEALLASDERGGEFLAAPVADLAAARFTNPTSSPAGVEFLAGRRVGSYEILREIGHGGMGTVYLANRADGQFRKRVAIKLVKPYLGTDEILRRFRNERQVVADLDHPNIAQLLDGGATEDGLPYLVMEYVEGAPIDAWCDSSKLSVRERVKLFRSVCAAVQYAHDKQVIHRDIKPANVLVTADGTPKLLDFGIAKVLNPDLSVQSMETATAGPGPMTPQYASPEQVRGEKVGPACDIYALGMVLYRLLTGRLPYSVQSADLRQVERVICEQEPVKPSVARGDSQLTGDLDNIVLKALRKEPERRYGSAAELSADLDRYLEHRPVQARRERLLYSAGKFVRRNRVPTMAAALSAALVLALVSGLGRFVKSDGGAGAVVRSIAVLPLEDLSHDPEQAHFADGMTDALIGDLAKIRSLRVISRNSVMRYKGLHKPAASVARELNANALVEGSVLRSGDRVRVSLRLTAGAMDRELWTQTYERDVRDVLALHGEAAKGIAREIEIRLTPQEQGLLSPSRPVNREAFDAYLKGRYHWYKYTQQGFEQSMRYFKEAIEIDPTYALAWAGLADTYYQVSNKFLPPAEAMPKAKAAAERALAIDGNLAEAHATLAHVTAQYDWDWAGAEKSYKRAIELNPSYAHGHVYYSFYLAELGRMEEAIREAREASRLDPLPPLISTNLAWIYYLARRTDQAIVEYRKILELEPDTAVTHYSLGLAYQQKRMFEAAIAELLKARALDKDCNDCLSYLGHAYAVSGNREQARRMLDKLLELSRELHIDPYWIGMVHAGLGEADEAFAWFEKAYQQRSEELVLIKVEPRLEPLRADSRFQSLMRRIGLPP